jgi:hypothetical protein
MESQELILDLVTINSEVNIPESTHEQHNNIYRGLSIRPDKVVFKSDYFILDFLRAFQSIAGRECAVKVRITKRLKTYIDINYPRAAWYFKVYDVKTLSFYSKEEIISVYPNMIEKKDGANYFPIGKFPLCLAKSSWTDIDNLLDYILEYEKINTEEDKREY